MALEADTDSKPKNGQGGQGGAVPLAAGSQSHAGPGWFGSTFNYCISYVKADSTRVGYSLQCIRCFSDATYRTQEIHARNAIVSKLIKCKSKYPVLQQIP